jgi:hypothetical protein
MFSKISKDFRWFAEVVVTGKEEDALKLIYESYGNL